MQKSSKQIITVVGARPQFIKAAAMSRVLIQEFPEIEERILHTGQHYDASMSAVFFEELGIPEPAFSWNFAQQGIPTLGQMIDFCTEVFSQNRPDAVLVYGDTNSTFAASTAANQLHIPIFHVEAGLRSFDKSMPEEVNRIFTDHVSSLLFCPTNNSVQNLENEGIVGNSFPWNQNRPGVFQTGDIMLDSALYFKNALKNSPEENPYVLLTLHRQQNVEDHARLHLIMQEILNLIEKEQYDLIFPMHPRTRKALLENNDALFHQFESHPNISIREPQPYLETLRLIQNSVFVMTDSGGLQKEAFFMGKSAVVLRPETEWVELVELGAALIVDADAKKFKDIMPWIKSRKPIIDFGPFGSGSSAKIMANYIHQFFFQT